MHNMFLQVVDFQDHIVLDSNEGIYQKFTLLNGFYFSSHSRIMTVDCNNRLRNVIHLFLFTKVKVF